MYAYQVYLWAFGVFSRLRAYLFFSPFFLDNNGCFTLLFNNTNKRHLHFFGDDGIITAVVQSNIIIVASQYSYWLYVFT